MGKLLNLTTAIAASLLCSAVSAKTIEEAVPVTNCRAYDGDTIYCDLPCKLSWRCEDVGIRIKWIDAPETNWRAKCLEELIGGQAAKGEMENLITYGGKVSIKNFNPKGAYGRIEADVLIRGVDAATHMLANKLVRASHGKRESWCTQEQIDSYKKFKGKK